MSRTINKTILNLTDAAAACVYMELRNTHTYKRVTIPMHKKDGQAYAKEVHMQEQCPVYKDMCGPVHLGAHSK